MLILLPPSEGKSAPRRGKPLALDGLSVPELTGARDQVLDALVRLCGDRERAAAVLGLGPTQADQAERNVGLRQAPAARADRIYTGVLYDALDLPGLDAAARRRAARRVLISSALFGVLHPTDAIPAYRLSAGTDLPGVGPIAGFWRDRLAEPMARLAGNGLVIDLRSGAYAAFWRPPADLAGRIATVRVLHESDGTRKVVSHFNKATKGRIVRDLLTDGGTPRTPAELATQLADLGWQVESGPAARGAATLNVIVADL